MADISELPEAWQAEAEAIQSDAQQVQEITDLRGETDTNALDTLQAFDEDEVVDTPDG